MLLLIVKACSIGASQKKEQVETVKQDTVPTINVTAEELINAYESNEVSADDQYKGKTLIVSGKVGKIGKDFFDAIYITLESDAEYRNVQCFIKDKQVAAKLVQGQYVSVQGKCDGLNDECRSQ